ncbi:MAG TPA: ATP-binding protein, partial [Thermoanaerobaculia bacterium]|nr:ATP-binding protein [Thermoanaerobaculia bacterium]
VRTILREGVGEIRADRAQIEQVLVNLAINARDAMPEGGELVVETDRVELDETYCRRELDVIPGTYVMLAVSDTGHGMEQAVKARIFEPFFTTKEKGKGTGLGLATVYGVVKQSGGHVAVYSEPGHGTTFRVYLPPCGEVGQSEGRAPGARSVPRGEETVLVVEDEETLRGLVRHCLEPLGYRVLLAENAAEALKIAEKVPGRIDLLLTDVVLPGWSGRELAERMAVARPSTRVLYMSGYTDDAIVRHGILSSELEFLQKPFTPGVLARRVRQVLDGPPR